MSSDVLSATEEEGVCGEDAHRPPSRTELLGVLTLIAEACPARSANHTSTWKLGGGGAASLRLQSTGHGGTWGADGLCRWSSVRNPSGLRLQKLIIVWAVGAGPCGTDLIQNKQDPPAGPASQSRRFTPVCSQVDSKVKGADPPVCTRVLQAPPQGPACPNAGTRSP